MKIRTGIFAALYCAGMLGSTVEAAAQGSGGDLLNEVPIWPVPAEMTLEEYTDANRRLSVGMMLMSIPLPGTLHFYAGERRAAWKHVGAAVLGGVAIGLGAAILDEKDNAWQSTSFETVDITGQNGKVRRYKKIPIEDEGGVVTHRLEELDRKYKNGGGGALIVLGAGLIVGQVLHDWIGGIKTIERKRDAVRYKYGKTAGYKLGMRPQLDVERRRVGAEVALRF